MGMYSSFRDESIEVTDWKGLKEFLKDWKKANKNSDTGWDEIFNKMIKKDGKKEYLTFEDWDDVKLISYWYDEVLIFLNCIAKYIEGNVNWEFENDDETGFVEFKDGKCEVTTGTMDYKTWKPTDSLDLSKIKGMKKKLLTLSSL